MLLTEEHRRFRYSTTYSCYMCQWSGVDDEVGAESKVDDKGRDYRSLHCPKCLNELLCTEREKVYY